MIITPWTWISERIAAGGSTEVSGLDRRAIRETEWVSIGGKRVGCRRRRRKGRRSLKPLRCLFRYLARYKSLVRGVVFLLMLAAATILWRQKLITTTG